MSGEREPRLLRGMPGIAALIMIVAIVAAAFLTASLFATIKTEMVEQRWTHTVGTADAVFDRYPAQEENESANTLAELTLPIGIDIAPRWDNERERPVRQLQADLNQRKIEISNYLELLESTERSPQPPSPALASFLDTHRADIDAVHAHLLQNGQPQWETDLSRLFAAPIPNLLGHMDLQKVLIADVLARNYAGERTGALDGMEASWVLNQGLRDDPVLITQLIAMSVNRMQLGALRQLPELPERWLERVTEHDFRASFQKALELEGWVWTQLDDVEMTVGDGFFQRVLLKFAKPYVSYCLADVSDDYRERLHNFASVETLCDADLNALGADLDISVPRWNVIGQIIVPNLGSAIDRLRRLELDIELTAKLLELDIERRRNGGQWPTRKPSLVSTSCPDDRWVFRTGDDGSVTISFSREISWPEQIGTILPMRFKLAKPGFSTR